MKLSCEQCEGNPGGLFKDGESYICGKCLSQKYTEEELRKKYPGRKYKEEQEALDKRVSEMKWIRLMDLPGYNKWAESYEGLDSLISNIKEYRIHIHNDEMKESLDWIFEREYGAVIADMNEKGAKYNLKKWELEDYKKPNQAMQRTPFGRR